MGYVDVANNFSINYYFSYILWILFSAGMLFELPVIVLILSMIGILTPAFMRHYRRHSVVTILILSALLTPPDPVSLMMMSVPLMILYEISIGISHIFGKKY
jgi:sec-independent protein translocase protein TatC